MADPLQALFNEAVHAFKTMCTANAIDFERPPQRECITDVDLGAVLLSTKIGHWYYRRADQSGRFMPGAVLPLPKGKPRLVSVVATTSAFDGCRGVVVRKGRSLMFVVLDSESGPMRVVSQEVS